MRRPQLRVALGPDVLALVSEPLAAAVDDDARGDRVDAGDDPAVEARAAGVDGHGMEPRGVRDRGGAEGEDPVQHRAVVERRAADREVVGGRAPALREPVDVGLEAAGREHDRVGLEPLPLAARLHDDRAAPVAVDLQVHQPRVVADRDARRGEGPVVGVDERLAATEEEPVGARQAERAAQRRLPARAVLGHPGPDGP